MNEAKKLIQQITEGIQDKKEKDRYRRSYQNRRYNMQLFRHLPRKFSQPSDSYR